MKFTLGMWEQKDGYMIQSPKEAYEVRYDNNKLTLYAPFAKAKERGNTLNSGLLTIVFFAPRTGVIGVRIAHYLGGRKKRARYDLDISEDTDTHFCENDDFFIFKTGDTEARIAKGGIWDISFFHRGRLLTQTKGKSMAYIEMPDGESFLRERLELSHDERIYGLGERFTAFVKNGQSVDMWNEDGGTESELTYKNIPFYISNKNYGVFVNDTRRVSFEVASEAASCVQFSLPGEQMEYYIIGGDSVKEVIGRYTDLSGKPSLPPAWSFGLWLTTSFTTDYSEKTVMHFIDGMIERGIPLSVFHFDCFWMKEFEWCNFLWDERFFPDPKGMLARIHEKGIKVCLWINPYIGQKSPLFQEGLENNYFVNTGTGDVWQWNKWQAGMALVDFSNPEATRWYQSKLEILLDMGVDSFKTDFGERIPTKDCYFGSSAGKEGISFANGCSADSMHNYYSYLYNEAVFSVLEKRFGKNNACVFARSATAGGQKFPAHWGGDSLSTYSSMAHSLRGGLSLALCGFGFWSHDIGGFEAGCHPDIYKRWTAFGLLSSHSRYHGNSEYKVPWLYGEEAVTVTSFFTRLKLRLMPYLFSAAVEAHHTGIPMMRPMMLEFPQDRTCQTLDLQYMLGGSLLIAPIFNNESRAEYYLPEGDWTHLLSGEMKKGPLWYEETYDYLNLPLYVRQNTVLVMGRNPTSPEYEYYRDIEAHVYALSDNTSATTALYGIDGKKKGEITITRKGDTYLAQTAGIKGNCICKIIGTSKEAVLPEDGEIEM